ncbi:MAG: hypothetical protein RLZZ299_983 [Pseudomonadota bacterium]
MSRWLRILALAAFAGGGSAAWAAEALHVVETAPCAVRADAEKLRDAAAAAGLPARVVRRFSLGQGWENVVIVESGTADAARSQALVLARLAALPVRVLRDENGRWVDVGEPVTARPDPGKPAGTVAELLARVEQAHGGRDGGARGLARAGAVHFVFSRTVTADGRTRPVRHDYWRDAAGRRLAIDADGVGIDSVAVASAGGAWLKTPAGVVNRDTGLLLTAVDAFAPEAVLNLALDLVSVLRTPEVERFRVLEGAESGVRVGSGGDESEPGLSFLDIDPATGRMLRARYVTEAGPVTMEASGWKAAAPGVVVPTELTVERADGSRETIRVERLEVAERVPATLLVRPG